MADNEPDPTANDIGVKQAVSIAKSYVRDLFADEGVIHPTLEEVWYDEHERVWSVTVGIRRQIYNNPFAALAAGEVDYRTVRVAAADGRPLSIRLHASAA
jgi:hypothetical protein